MSRRKTVLVTGCSAGGLGVAFAQAFQGAGCHVFATARNPSKIPDSLTSLPHVEVLALDVTSAESISSCVSEIKTRTENRLDVLVNNAGWGILMPLLDTSIEEAKGVFDVNFWGVLAMVKACAPLLINARGVVVNISSIAGVLALPWQGMYMYLKHHIYYIHRSPTHLYCCRSHHFLSSCLTSLGARKAPTPASLNSIFIGKANLINSDIQQLQSGRDDAVREPEARAAAAGRARHSSHGGRRQDGDLQQTGLSTTGIFAIRSRRDGHAKTSHGPASEGHRGDGRCDRSEYRTRCPRRTPYGQDMARWESGYGSSCHLVASYYAY